MSRAPTRRLDVFVVGAGLSAALRLPNTRELLHQLHDLADGQPFWGQTRNLTTRLEGAYEFLYPEDVTTGYRPDAVDFFSLLKAYGDIGTGLPGGLTDSRTLLTDLKFALANVLIVGLRSNDEQLQDSHAELDRLLTPGNVVITLNWDTLLERYAYLHGIPIRLSGDPDDSSVLVLKLHGSIDWTLRSDCQRTRTVAEYAVIRERISAAQAYTIRISSTDNILRIRALEHWATAWQRVKAPNSRTVHGDDVTGEGGRLKPNRRNLGAGLLRPERGEASRDHWIFHATR